MSTESFQRRLTEHTNTLNASIDGATQTLLSRFQDIADIAMNQRKDKHTVSSEVYQIECHTLSMIRAVEQLLDISRQLKSFWLCNSSPTTVPSLSYNETDLVGLRTKLTSLQNIGLDVKNSLVNNTAESNEKNADITS
ncbi:mediator complex subunit Srb6 [Schizosaccharomyces cryophilus OY26]|uniref:Mediator complex subunit Srb6 n=1 Tax=Schizosaccharomyces cryophilus (strain OY26 / ATCC MYA-4695 / CBS 11777 / NBRC 106824 / NRRL Y48691) TaxID=653667 RepID=S9VVM5_SCHCR|nr:mediator complex subunit Srb6 [Schizosaccharomyces cryophilus OY26]EPY50229.1 mediator complex subunit Srb6 [Schizosaccharomyces cryophilus OY26]